MYPTLGIILVEEKASIVLHTKCDSPQHTFCHHSFKTSLACAHPRNCMWLIVCENVFQKHKVDTMWPRHYTVSETRVVSTFGCWLIRNRMWTASKRQNSQLTLSATRNSGEPCSQHYHNRFNIASWGTRKFSITIKAKPDLQTQAYPLIRTASETPLQQEKDT